MLEKRQPLLVNHMQNTETRSLPLTLYQNQLKVDQRPWNFETTTGSSRKYTGKDRNREDLPKQNSKSLTSKRKNEQMGLH
jgi:hypothetical protein